MANGWVYLYFSETDPTKVSNYTQKLCNEHPDMELDLLESYRDQTGDENFCATFTLTDYSPSQLSKFIRHAKLYGQVMWV